MNSRIFVRYFGIFSILFAAGLILAQQVAAIPPSEEALKKWDAEGVLEQKLANWQAFHEAGGDSPSKPSVLDRVRAHRSRSALDANVEDTVNAVVIMVDFSDWPWDGQEQDGTPANFDSILFSDRRTDPIYNPTGSMTDFYLETSYGKLFIHGEVYGWYRMPNTYAYYVGTNDGLSLGSTLARHAVFAADPDIDFSRFATGGEVDGVIVIHPGAGAETGAYGIWSHKSTISGQPTLDGVLLSAYSVNPEEYGGGLTPIGVYAHEHGHILGLPDLYDADNTPATSQGLGSWSLMASGSYNGGMEKPAHLDPWCKKQLGFLTYSNVPSNLDSVAIPAAEWNPIAYQIKDTDLVTAKEYWLVENRQPYGFDVGLPGFGLLIYHIDEAVYGNTNHLRYMVALEQADGLNSLALGGSRGDNADPWPGSSNNRHFHDQSVPNSRANSTNKVTEVAVWDISDLDSVMYADLDFTFSRPFVSFTGTDSLQFQDVAGGNGNGVIEQGETIQMSCRLKNTMRNGYNWYMTLSTDNPDIQITANHTQQSSQMLRTAPSVLTDNPVQFSLVPGATSTISTFTLTITIDSVNGSGDEKFSKVYTFRQPVGKPDVLIVDDDNGQAADALLSGSFNDLLMPQTVWHKTSGTPAASLLQQHKYVFWMSGDKPTGSFTAADVAALKAYLDAGGNLAITSVTAAPQLHLLDSVFMRDYLHARYKDSVGAGTYFYGVSGNPVSQNLRWRYLSTVSTALKRSQLLEPTSTGLASFKVTNSIIGSPILGTNGVAHAGTYKTVFTTFALEYISDRDTASNYAHRDSLTERILRFFDDTVSNYSAPQVTRLVTVGEQQQHVLSATPKFAWSFFAAGINMQDSAEFEFGTDSDWSLAELWDPSVRYGADTTVIYAGAALSDGITYYARVRMHNGMLWSEWYQTSFKLNGAPGTPAQLVPTAESVMGVSGTMTAQAVTDPDGDGVTYQFAVWVDSTLSFQEYTLTTGATSIAIPGGALAENSRRWWQVRSYDGYEYSAWSAATPFWVDMSPQTPSLPANLNPSSTSVPAFTLTPALTWNASVDGDPVDTVKYVVELADNLSFTGAKSSGEITAATFTFTDSLAFGTHYWWRVTASDRGGHSAQSSVVNFWTWRLGDLNSSHVTDLTDLSQMIAYLLGGGSIAITPKLLGDLNADCKIDLSDLSRLISYLTGGGAQLLPGC